MYLLLLSSLPTYPVAITASTPQTGRDGDLTGETF